MQRIKQHSQSGSSRLTRREMLRIAGLGAIALGFSGCQALQSTSQPTASLSPVAIRYATGGATPPTEMEMAIFSEKLQKNVLQHYGKEYTTSITATKGTPEAQGLLVAGQADLASLAFSTIATTVSKSAVPGGIAVVAAHFIDGQPGYGGNAYLVLKESGIRTAADLKGKTVGVNALGTAVDVIMRVWLRRNGLEPKTDVQFVEVGFGAMGAALREKRVDVASLVQPFIAVEQAKGGVSTLFKAAEAIGPYSSIAVVARSKFLEENPQPVRAFIDDWVRGLDWLIDPKNRDQAIQIMSDISKTPTETLALFYGKPEVDYYRNVSACPSAQALQAGVDAMVAEGYLKERIEIAPLVNTSYLPKACA